MEILSTIFSYVIATPDIVGSVAVWLFGIIVHAVTGTVVTGSHAAGCLVEGELIHATNYLLNEFGNAVVDKVNSGKSIIEGSLTQSLGTTVINMADMKADQVIEGWFDSAPCPE